MCCAGAPGDQDGDGICDAHDVCVFVGDPVQEDLDADGVGDACDVCAGLGLARFASPVSLSSEPGDDVAAADLDADGDLDLVTASLSDATVGWYENLGANAFSGITVLSAAETLVQEVAVMDVDGDGDLDLLASVFALNRVDWFENLGAGAFVGPQVLVTASGPVALSTGDVNGDGLVDLLVVVNFFGIERVQLAPNLGGGVFGTLTDVVDPGGSATLGDLDGDGDLDILVAVERLDEVRWSENQGGAQFGPAQVLAAIAAPQAIVAHDLDQDGDLDAGFVSGDDLAWMPNLGGASFDPPQVVPTGLVQLTDVAVADFDGDGLPDLLTAGVTGGAVWIRNTGGAFGAAEAVGDEAALLAVLAADLDGDLALDALFEGATGLFWAQNLSTCLDADSDGDGLADAAELLVYGTDPTAADASPQAIDRDGDGVASDTDLCPLVADPAQLDSDLDGAGDACDPCLGDDASGDPDYDGLCSDLDLCDLVPDPLQPDGDGDGTGDACDACAAPGDGLDRFSDVESARHRPGVRPRVVRPRR